MTTSKKPACSPVPAQDAPPRDPTPEDAFVLSAFRAMDACREQEAVDRMKRIAKTHPGAAPFLRLVSGGAA